MKFLVVGLGSMGKRRIRCLKKLKYNNVYGFDLNKSRNLEVKTKYKIQTFSNFKDAYNTVKPDVLIISTPPDKHYSYARFSAKNNKDCFIEASVETSAETLKLKNYGKKMRTMILPSCTMQYFKSPKIIKKLIKNNEIGKVWNINYQIGQYLPDWHPWENIKNFYVSKKKTGACREIVPFELNWICDIFGIPKVINSHKNKLSNLDMDADDIYHFTLKFPKNIIANITVEVLSRVVPTRIMTILGSKGKICLNYEDKIIKLYKPDNSIKIFKINEGKPEKGYVYSEKPYIDEMENFINAVKKGNKKLFPNNLQQDSYIFKILEEIEKKVN